MDTWASPSLFQRAPLPFYILPKGPAHSRACQGRGWSPATHTHAVHVCAGITQLLCVVWHIPQEGTWVLEVCVTSSLNWLLSHMDLKLLLFSKSVIFIFNCRCMKRERQTVRNKCCCIGKLLTGGCRQHAVVKCVSMIQTPQSKLNMTAFSRRISLHTSSVQPQINSLNCHRDRSYKMFDLENNILMEDDKRLACLFWKFVFFWHRDVYLS